MDSSGWEVTHRKGLYSDNMFDDIKVTTVTCLFLRMYCWTTSELLMGCCYGGVGGQGGIKAEGRHYAGTAEHCTPSLEWTAQDYSHF